jgi:hypothetical protein
MASTGRNGDFAWHYDHKPILDQRVWVSSAASLDIRRDRVRALELRGSFERADELV